MASLVDMSKRIDQFPANLAATALEQLLQRTSLKLTEEAGEVAGALIGMTGQNPRKGVTHSIDDVIKELLDVIVTALGGIEHATGNEGRSMEMLFHHMKRLDQRIAQQFPPDSPLHPNAIAPDEKIDAFLGTGPKHAETVGPPK